MGTNADVSFLSGGREAVARDPAVRNGGLGGRRWPETLQSETVAWEVGLPACCAFCSLAACAHPGCLSKAVGLVTVAALGVYL